MTYVYCLAKVIIVVGLSLTLLSFETKEFNGKHNPTEFTFNTELDSVKQAIMNAFDGKYYRGLRLEYPQKRIIFSEIAKKFFLDSNNVNDFCLQSTDRIGKSGVYFGQHHKEYDYYAEFYLHLVCIDHYKTVVIIKTINPRIVIGTNLLPSFPHFGANYRYRSIKPSTIEEYEILREIGARLSMQNQMPEIIYPSEDRK